jgi:SpoVK/Ycf46/Vps4 family AAA+-type ATPase
MEAMNERRYESNETSSARTSVNTSPISLSVLTPGDNQQFDLPRVPATMTPASIVEQLVARGHLPQLPGGQRYQLARVGDDGLLHHMDETQPLSANGVETGMTLRAITTTPGAAETHSTLADRDGCDAAAIAPPWLQEIEAMHAARAAHFFLLHFNVSDYVFDGSDAPRRLLTYLGRRLAARGYNRLALVNLSCGVGWVNGDAAAVAPADTEPSAIVRRLADTLAERADHTTAVLIENVEHLAPAGGPGDRETLRAVEVLVRLAQDESLRATGCLIMATCRSLESVAPGLIDATGGVRPVHVPLPSSADRLRFLRYLESGTPALGLARLEDGLTCERFANLTQGVTLAELDTVNRQAALARQPITYARLRDCKKTSIERQGRGLIDELEPRYGFEAIGGLAHVIRYLESAVGHLRENRPNSAPKGVLLVGPPGTGKTLVAEALAKEAGFNFVRIGDVRSMWIGESERNLSHVLRLLVELAPVVVFVDEVDQMLGRRDQGWNGDSGVSARLFAQILNFMGRNEHRGRIIWVAATNRPDLLDEAMLRRFDRVFPFFLPSDIDRARILAAMPAITGATYVPGISFSDVVNATKGLSGSALELIVRRAMELADGAPLTQSTLLQAAQDYKPNHDAREYQRQSLLAFEAANLFSSLPPLEELPDDIADLVREKRRRSAGDHRLRQAMHPATV